MGFPVLVPEQALRVKGGVVGSAEDINKEGKGDTVAIRTVLWT